MQELFGQVVDPFNSSQYRIFGMYIDEDGIQRMMGSFYHERTIGIFTTVFGMEHTVSYDSEFAQPEYGTYLVRSVIPVPASVYLFGSAIGLLGYLRRRKH